MKLEILLRQLMSEEALKIQRKQGAAYRKFKGLSASWNWKVQPPHSASTLHRELQLGCGETVNISEPGRAKTGPSKHKDHHITFFLSFDLPSRVLLQPFPLLALPTSDSLVPV